MDGVMECDSETQAQVDDWRLEQLELAGYPRGDAYRIAQSSADLHRACELIKQGCPSQVAVDILT